MFQDYVDFMARKMTDPGLNEDDILESFSVFDKDKKGLVNVKELADVMSKMGEPMTSKEIDTVLKDAEIDGDGMMKYADFVKRLNDLYEVFPSAG